MTTITLQDLDNRDDDGQPFQFTGTTDKVIGYLDGPVRRDLIEAGDGAGLLNVTIDHLKADRLVPAASILDGFGIRLIAGGMVLERTCSSCGRTSHHKQHHEAEDTAQYRQHGARGGSATRRAGAATLRLVLDMV